MKLPSTRTLAMIAVAVLLVIGLLWMRSCQAEREAKRRADITAKARGADAGAAAARQADVTEIHRNQEAITNALAPLPDADLTDRQRARYCAIWLRDHDAPCSAESGPAAGR